jgi:hypothetical protein
MRKLRIISLVAILTSALAGNSIADIPELVIWEGSGTYEIGSGKDWFAILELRTYDNVTVVMPGGGGK